MQNTLPPLLLLRHLVPLTADIDSYINLLSESDNNLQLVSSTGSSNYNPSSKSGNNPSSKSNKLSLYVSISE